MNQTEVSGGGHLGTHCDTPGARISHSGEPPPPGWGVRRRLVRLPSEVSPEVSPDPSSLVSVESRIRSHPVPVPGATFTISALTIHHVIQIICARQYIMI